MSSTFQKAIAKVKPTVFNGDPLLWLDWIGLFNATIHSSDMTTAEKMTHLRTLVKDQAKSVIRGYGYNGDMYFIALKRLQDSFGNPTKIVTSFLQRLNCHPIPTLEQPDSFTVYSNFLTTLFDTFEQLDFQHDIRSTTNVQQALRKLPTETRLTSLESTYRLFRTQTANSKRCNSLVTGIRSRLQLNACTAAEHIN